MVFFIVNNVACGNVGNRLYYRVVIQTTSKIDYDSNDSIFAVHYAVGYYVPCGYITAVYAIYRVRLPRDNRI